MSDSNASSIRPHSFPFNEGSFESESDTPSSARKKMKVRINYSPIEDWLLHDADTPSIMTHYLTCLDVARLHSTCKSCREYISRPNLCRSSLLSADIQFDQLTQASTSSWLPHFLQKLHVNFPLSLSHQSRFLPSCLQLLTFRSVTSLSLELPVCLQSTCLFDLLGCLTSLQSLVVNLTAQTDIPIAMHNLTTSVGETRFTSLQNCKRLSKFVFVYTEPWSYNGFYPSKEVQDLIGCKSLTYLDCGTWVGDHLAMMDIGRSRSHQQRVQESIALLPQLPLLQHLELNSNQSCSREDLKNLQKITSLTHLTPFKPNCTPVTRFGGWSLDIVEEWRDLTVFHSLNTFAFRVYGRFAYLPASLKFAFSQMSTITNLQLTSVFLKTEELTELFKWFPQLVKFDLSGRLQSCDSFFNAPASLRILHLACHDYSYSPIYYHLCLPTIKSLEELYLEVSWLKEVEWSDFMNDYSMQSVSAITAAFSFMIKARMPNIKNDNIYDSH